MKHIQSWRRYIACALLAVMILLACGGIAQVEAASGAITVTEALTGKEIYSGDSMKDAMAAATKASIVSVNAYYDMEENAIVDCEVAITGLDRISWLGGKLLLTGDGAVYLTQYLNSRHIKALYSYSTVEMAEELDGFVYYVNAGVPDFSGAGATTITNGSGLIAHKIDESAATIWLDTSAGGFSAENLAKQMSVPAINVEKVAITCTTKYVANGATVTATATNYDYDGKVTKSYKLLVLGDVNGNGRIDAADANLIACHAAGLSSLTGDALLAADANRDGEVTAADADLLCRKYIRRDSYASPLG